MLSLTRPSLRAVVLSAVLSAPLLATALPAAAQAGRDPADIRGGARDPAAVGAPQRSTGSGAPSADDTARFMRSIGAVYVPDTPPVQPLPADAAQTLQSMLYTARDLGNARYDVTGRQRAGIDALRRDMERVATQLWPHLSPQTQDRYREALDRVKRLDQLENTDYRDVDAFRARGGAAGMLRQTEETVRSLEEAIAPMLQDVRSKLQQQASPAYGR